MSLSAYIHIPFCKKKCSYCAFYSASASGQTIEEYVKALENQIRHSDYKGCKLTSVFFGGGTPSILLPQQYTRILNAIDTVFDISSSEITTEINPDSVSNLLDIGLADRFTRFSMGVQSFDDEELSLLGRVHTSSQAVDAFKSLRNAGADNINIDLMLALPSRDHLNKLKSTLEKAISLSPEHISAYILTPEEGTLFFDNFAPVSDELSDDAYLLTCEFLEEAGYEHYEISNFAKKGFRCRHNMSYWTQEKYLAFGPSSCGFDGKNRYRIDCSVNEYIKNNGIVPPIIEETLTDEDLRSEKIMLSLRLSDGIDRKILDEICKNDEKKRFVDYLLDSSLAVKNESGGISLTDRGFLLSNRIISELM